MGLFFRPRRPLLRLAAGAAPEKVAYQAAPPAARDSTAELERLARLHSSGALTDREFAAAKARLLGLSPEE